MNGDARNAASAGRVTVWHDSSCPLCGQEIALMRRLGTRGAITFIDAGEGAAVCPVDRAGLLQRFHARETGRMLFGAAAFAAMWRAIPLLRPLGLVARNPTVLTMLEWVDRHFLTARPALQTIARRLELRPA